MNYKYAPYWKQILALLIDGIVGYLLASIIFIGISLRFTINYMLVAFISTFALQVFFYYGYGNKSFGDHILGINVKFAQQGKSKLYNAMMVSFGKTIMVVPYGIPFFGVVLALINLLVTIIFLLIPSYRVKKHTGWNYGIAYMVENDK